MDAIVIAGGIPEEGEPLYEYTRGASKALLEIAGKPMIQWVLDALNGASLVKRVVIIGLPEDSGVSSSKVAAFLPNQGGMIDNIRVGINKTLEINPGAEHVLVASSDIPTIKPEMVDWLINTAIETDDDLYYNVVQRAVMEERFPASKRSYVRLKDMEVCGADMNIVRASLVSSENEIWDRLIAARKNAVKQAALMGFDTLILLLFRAVTLDQAVKKVAKRLNITGRAIVCPYAEMGMDVDKPHQLEVLRADLARESIN